MCHTPKPEKKNTKTVKYALFPHILEEMRFAPGNYWNTTRTNREKLKEDIKEAIGKAWMDWQVEHEIFPISQKWIPAQGGVPALVVEMPKACEIWIRRTYVGRPWVGRS